jgi:ubiquitin-protein ligase E3 C
VTPPPVQAPAGGAAPPPAAPPSDPAFALLTEFAPRLLRELYERDVRRPYCQPLLWLAPYNEMFGEARDAMPQAPPPPPPRCEAPMTGY